MVPPKATGLSALLTFVPNKDGLPEAAEAKLGWLPLPERPKLGCAELVVVVEPKVF